jgi:hypothetical protein
MTLVLGRGIVTRSDFGNDRQMVKKSSTLQKHPEQFADILRIIQSGRSKAFEAVNVALIAPIKRLEST